MTDAVKDYESSLKDLTFNSKPLINMLTMLAEECIAHAPEIVKLIEAKLLKNKPSAKLCIFYLLDSIIKNMKGRYLELFTENIVDTFCGVFEQVDEKTRQSLFKLRSTWKDFFPVKKLYALDMRVKTTLDPAWPVMAVVEPKPKAVPPPSPSPAIHINPKFIKKPEATTSTAEPQLSESERQEAEMRQQLIAKQQQLLQLHQQRLEFELQQTKAKLEEQAKELELKNAQLVKQQSQQFMQQQQQAKQASTGTPQNVAVPLNLPTQVPAPNATAATTLSSRDPRLAASRDPRIASRDPRVRGAAGQASVAPPSPPVVPPPQQSLPPPPQQTLPLPPQQSLPPPTQQSLPPPPQQTLPGPPQAAPSMQPTLPLHLPSSQPVPLPQPPLPPPVPFQGLPPVMPIPPQPIPPHVLAQFSAPMPVQVPMNQWPMQQPSVPEQPPLPPAPPSSAAPKPPEPVKKTTPSAPSDPRNKQQQKETKDTTSKNKKQEPKKKTTSKPDDKETNKNKKDDNKAKSSKEKNSQIDEDVVEIKSVKKTEPKKSTWLGKGKESKSLPRIPKRRSARSRSRSRSRSPPRSRSPRSRSRSPRSRSPRGADRRDRNRDRDRPKDWDRDKGKEKSKGPEKPKAKTSPKPKNKGKVKKDADRKPESVKRTRKSSKETSDESSKESDSSSKNRKATPSLEKESKRQKVVHEDGDAEWAKRKKGNRGGESTKPGPSGERSTSPSSKRRRSSIDPNVKIPKELSLEKHHVILAQAEKQLQSGELSHEQHQQLLKQLHELYEFQKLRVQEAVEQETLSSAQDRPADPRFLEMVQEMETGRRKSDSDDRTTLFPPRDVDMRFMDPSRLTGPEPPKELGQLPPVDQDERQLPKGDVDLRPTKLIDARPLSDTYMRQSDKDERNPPLSGDRDERLLKGRDKDERIHPDRNDRPPLNSGRDKDDRPPRDRLEMIGGRDQDERLSRRPPGHPDEPLRAPLGRIPRRTPVSEPERPRLQPEEAPNRRPPREEERMKSDGNRRGRGKGERPPALQREEPVNLRHRPPRHEFESTRNMDLPPRLDKELEVPGSRGGPPPHMQRFEDRRRGGWSDRRGPGPEPFDRDDRPHPGRNRRDGPPQFMESDHPEDFDDRRFGPPNQGGRRRGPGDERRYPRDARDRGPPPDFDERGPRGRPQRMPADRPDFPHGPPDGRSGGPPRGPPDGPPDMIPLTPDALKDILPEILARRKSKSNVPLVSHQQLESLVNELPPQILAQLLGDPSSSPSNPDGSFNPVLLEQLAQHFNDITKQHDSGPPGQQGPQPPISGPGMQELPMMRPGMPGHPGIRPGFVQEGLPSLLQMEIRPPMLERGPFPGGPPGHMIRGPHPGGPDMRGPHPVGPDMRGPIPVGPDMRGPMPGGPDMRGPHPGGPDMRGPIPVGPDMREPIPGGPDMRGPHPGGPDMRGPMPGPDMMGPGPGGLIFRGPGPGGMNMGELGPGGPDFQGQAPGGMNMRGPAPGGPMHAGPGLMMQGMPGGPMGPGPAGQLPPDIPGMPPHLAAQLQKPAERDSPQLSSQVDINSLFSKLLQTGIIREVRADSPQNTPPTSEAPAPTEPPAPSSAAEDSQDAALPLDLDNLKITMEPCSPEEMFIPDIGLQSNELKVRQPGVIRRIYCGTKCSSCGMRFVTDEMDRYRKHLDWHFRQNQKKTDTTHKVVMSRKWYYPVEDWMKFEEMNEEEAKSDVFEALVQDNKVESIEKDGIISVPINNDVDNDDICKICNEPFEQYWDEDEEMWLLRDALRHKGKTYHPLCYEDALENFGGLDTTFEDIPGTPFARTPRSSLESSFKSPTTFDMVSAEEQKPTGAEVLLKPALSASQETLVISSSEESGMDSDAGIQRKLVMDVKKEILDDNEKVKTESQPAPETATIDSQPALEATKMEPQLTPEAVKIKSEPTPETSIVVGNVSVKPDPDSTLAKSVKAEPGEEPPVSMEGVKSESEDVPSVPMEGIKTEEDVAGDNIPESQVADKIVKEALPPTIPGLTLTLESEREPESENVVVKSEFVMKEDKRTNSDTEQTKSQVDEIDKLDTKIKAEPELLDIQQTSSMPNITSKPKPSKPTSNVAAKPKWSAASEWGKPKTVLVRSIPIDVRLSRESSPTREVRAPAQDKMDTATISSEEKQSGVDKNETAVPSSDVDKDSAPSLQESQENIVKSSAQNQEISLKSEPIDVNKDLMKLFSDDVEQKDSTSKTSTDATDKISESAPIQTVSSQEANTSPPGEVETKDVNIKEGSVSTRQSIGEDQSVTEKSVENASLPDTSKDTVQTETDDTSKETDVTSKEAVKTETDDTSKEADKTETDDDDDFQPPGTPLMDEPEEKEEGDKPGTPPGTPLMDEPAEKVGDAPQDTPANVDPSVKTSETSQDEKPSEEEHKTEEEKPSEEIKSSADEGQTSDGNRSETEQQQGSQEKQDIDQSNIPVLGTPPQVEEQQSITVVGRPRVNPYGYSSPRRGSPRRDDFMHQTGFEQPHRGHYRGGHSGFDPHGRYDGPPPQDFNQPDYDQNPSEFGRGRRGRGRGRVRVRVRGRGRGNWDSFGAHKQVPGGEKPRGNPQNMSFADDQY